MLGVVEVEGNRFQWPWDTVYVHYKVAEALMLVVGLHRQGMVQVVEARSC